MPRSKRKGLQNDVGSSIEKYRIKEKMSGYIAIGTLVLIILVLLLTLCLPLREWCSYNLLHRPFYLLFSGCFYVSYFMDFLKIALLFLLIGFMAGGAFWVIVSEILKINFTGLKRTIALVIAVLLILILFTFGKSYVEDFDLVFRGKYDVEESYLFKIKKDISKSRKKPHWDVWADYKLYTNTVAERYSELEVKWYFKCVAESSEKTFYIYEFLNLDVCQYNDLKKDLIEKNSSDSIPMKVYYLPHTRQVLRYELQDLK
ncbi:hypothetical protein JGH11_01715 [Dysgonomonas sp. Marseille-P4677]|uniref:hypothetical protein n=1 Tax=Dysgonomonas sp. Marseille-P4677 TaxID=2364790 RepID=UPI0019134795|nr:hypothetical protein [Dysgonomonas sp. Marseille-P4677]MBK5719580.1 hypothetical protein [Dysgonomonas sp. Marseille-P4677]